MASNFQPLGTLTSNFQPLGTLTRDFQPLGTLTLDNNDFPSPILTKVLMKKEQTKVYDHVETSSHVVKKLLLTALLK